MRDENTGESGVKKPNLLGSFLGGFGSGATSGAVMMGIFWAVAQVTLLVAGHAILPIPGLGYMALMSAVTGLFTGAMGVLRGEKDARKAAAIVPGPNMAPVLAEGLGRGQQMSMDAAEDMTPGRRDGQSWAAYTSRGDTGQSRIQQIINDGALSDKDRAGAILAEREQAAAAQASRA